MSDYKHRKIICLLCDIEYLGRDGFFIEGNGKVCLCLVDSDRISTSFQRLYIWWLWFPVVGGLENASQEIWMVSFS